MKVEWIQPFVTSAIRVLEAELGMEAQVGELAAERAANTTQEVSVLIGVTGQVEGTVIYGTSKLVATEMVMHLTGERRPVFDEVSESAMGELGNIISGGAAALFEESGIHCSISPPTVIVGRAPSSRPSNEGSSFRSSSPASCTSPSPCVPRSVRKTPNRDTTGLLTIRGRRKGSLCVASCMGRSGALWLRPFFCSAGERAVGEGTEVTELGGLRRPLSSARGRRPRQGRQEVLPGVRLEHAFGAGPALVEALFAGAIDIAYLGPSPAVNAFIRSGGEALRIVAGSSVGGSGFVAARGWNPQRAEDFFGRRVGTPQIGNTQDVSLRAYLASLGVRGRR